MAHSECHHLHNVASPSVFQTLEELDFEKGIWSSALNGETGKLIEQLEKGINPSVCDSSGYTALHYAARNGKEYICSLLLQRGAEVNAQTHGGATPLLRAASQGHSNIVEMLLKNNGDPCICDSDGKTPLHKAAEGSHLSTVKILLEYKPELKSVKDNKGNLPVFYVPSNCMELLKILSA